MIAQLARNQNWAKAAPWLGVLTIIGLFILYSPDQAMFWALLNIPLYLFHQTEEHYIPGGFKQYINKVINNGQEILTDIKVFWINIILVWLAFIVFGVLALFNIGFGLLIIIFSIINCATHIRMFFIRKEWNPGLIVASIQFILSIYGAYFITTHGGLHQVLWWWVGTIIFAILAHVIMFYSVMKR
jgi:hypothetical protein